MNLYSCSGEPAVSLFWRGKKTKTKQKSPDTGYSSGQRSESPSTPGSSFLYCAWLSIRPRVSGAENYDQKKRRGLITRMGNDFDTSAGYACAVLSQNY